jgi:hypothetical protein
MSNFLFPEKILRLITPPDIVAQHRILKGFVSFLLKSVATLTNYNVPSLKQQNKASTILSEIMLPETSNIDDVVNDQTEHKNNTPAIENVAVDIQNPTNSQSVNKSFSRRVIKFSSCNFSNCCH